MSLGTERKINEESILLSSIRGLGGEIRPHMREISVAIDPNKNMMTLYFYYDRPHTEEEENYDIEGTISVQIVSDFPFEFNIEEKIIVIPYPEKIHPVGTPIYRRYEP